MNKITFFEVYLVDSLCHYLINNNHFSLTCFTVGFSFRCNWKAPREISSRARIIHGHFFMQILDCLDHGDPQCQRLSSCTFLKEKAIPSPSAVLCCGNSSIPAASSGLESGHLGGWCPTELFQHPVVPALGSEAAVSPLGVHSSIFKDWL